MKKLTLIIVLFAALSANAQAQTAQAPGTLSYRVDYIRPDSFYLVEVKALAPEAPGKRGKIEEESILLTDTSQLQIIIQQAARQEAEHLRRADEFRVARESVQRIYATLRERKEEPKQ